MSRRTGFLDQHVIRIVNQEHSSRRILSDLVQKRIFDAGNRNRYPQDVEQADADPASRLMSCVHDISWLTDKSNRRRPESVSSIGSAGYGNEYGTGAMARVITRRFVGLLSWGSSTSSCLSDEPL